MEGGGFVGESGMSELLLTVEATAVVTSRWLCKDILVGVKNFILRGMGGGGNPPGVASPDQAWRYPRCKYPDNGTAPLTPPRHETGLRLPQAWGCTESLQPAVRRGVLESFSPFPLSEEPRTNCGLIRTDVYIDADCRPVTTSVRGTAHRFFFLRSPCREKTKSFPGA